ncbi:hypothetical protein HZA38_05555 [Candidatus Peregrinibacteria bacterium]|nr:hypothetical protein [Candidatus Peregrinibacteria bacterium]
MGNFHNKRSGGGFGGHSRGNDFGRSRGGFGAGDRRPEMHSATCSECGNDCEVPFRPTGERPVYCSDCFKSMNSSSGGRDFGRKEFGGRDRGDRADRGGDRGRSDFGEKRMYKVVCAECGDDCEVPFRPTGEKPVYCSKCFGKDDGGFKPKKSGGDYAQEFERLNSKLDKIIKALEAAGLKKEAAIVKPILEEKKEEPKKAASQEKSKKKEREEKAAPKKVVKAKKKSK